MSINFAPFPCLKVINDVCIKANKKATSICLLGGGNGKMMEGGTSPETIHSETAMINF